MPHDDQTRMQDRRRKMSDGTGMIASSVISELGNRQLRSQDGARQLVVDHLARAVLSPDEFDAKRAFSDLLGHRLTADAVVDLYIPNAARALGQQWVDDSISFAQVTIGALRLQSILGQATSQLGLDVVSHGSRPRAMVVLPQGEQHFLGVNVVAAQLARIGYEVDISFDEPLSKVEWRVNEFRPGIVLISCSRNESLEAIQQIVQLIRAVDSGNPFIALGGAVLFDTENLVERTGVDMVTASAKDAAAASLHGSKELARL